MSQAAVLLLSGGMDSACLAYWLRPSVAVTIDYGQFPAQGEIEAASAMCRAMDLRHEVLRVDCRMLGSGDLANCAPLSIAPIPEWWPFRNQLLITLAATRFIGEGVKRVILGTVRSDDSHADGTIHFMTAISSLLQMQEGALRVEAPAIHLSAAELVRQSGIPFEVLAWAHSCHMSDFACGACRGCHKHFATMKELGIGPY
jgi:7-cyano-7-deazaguanine synthase